MREVDGPYQITGSLNICSLGTCSIVFNRDGLQQVMGDELMRYRMLWSAGMHACNTRFERLLVRFARTAHARDFEWSDLLRRQQRGDHQPQRRQWHVGRTE